MPFKDSKDFFHFQLLVKYRYRYTINKEVQDFLSNVLESLEHRVATISEGQNFWRAQIGYEENTATTEDGGFSYEQLPYSEARMKPDSRFSGDGRVNPKGIASLYLASTKETAMSEIRPWKEAKISCAKFEITRQLRIIDCTVHAGKTLSESKRETQQDIQEAVWSDIDEAFSRPVSVSEESVEYIPTQILAELFKSQGFDGVAYKSSLTSGGYNLALFKLDSADMEYCQLFSVKNITFDFSESSQSLRVKNDRG